MKTVIGGYLWYVAANFQQLHNKFVSVGYINLMDDQGKPDNCSRSMREMPRSMREIPRRVKDAPKMADGCSVVHPYYYCNHDT